MSEKETSDLVGLLKRSFKPGHLSNQVIKDLGVFVCACMCVCVCV